MGETVTVESVDELVTKLNDRSGKGDDAMFELIDRGIDVVPVLASRVATLERFGKLSAIEVFEALQDARACAALLALLADEDETVMEWSAEALGALRCPDAVQPLERVLARLIAEQVPPDWIVPITVRVALAELGARRPVVPSVTTNLQVRRDDTETWLCRSSDLAAVVDDLAEHRQVVLGFTLWRIRGDGLSWTKCPCDDWSFDWSARWADNVSAAWQAARRSISTITPSSDLLAHVSWIDEADVTLQAV
jgi:hypothetical protein